MKPLCFLVTILWTSVQDLRFHRIPNQAVLFGFVSAFCLAWEQGGGAACLGALGASLLGFLIHWPGYCRGELGGGDVKLFSAYCALSGLSHMSKLIPAYGICLAALLLFVKIRGARTGRGAAAPLAPWMAAAVILSML
ncbi:MAG: prepilin peptidase [Peptococcaceae bacterium]|jgi:Flp pilus assembly protein protease CpaA|nr:prepilin peptidase [Peptococcaceae bacterium]